MNPNETEISTVVKKLDIKNLVIINIILFLLLVGVGVYTHNYAYENRNYINIHKDSIELIELKELENETKLDVLQQKIDFLEKKISENKK